MGIPLTSGPGRTAPLAPHNPRHLEFIGKLEQAEFTPKEILEIEFSYNLAKNAHFGAVRQGGERYFEHVRAVAESLIDIRTTLLSEGKGAVARKAVTKRAIIEAFNHDTVEDTDIWGGGGRLEHEQPAVVEWRLTHVHGVDTCKGISALSKVGIAEDDPQISIDVAKALTIRHIAAADPEDQLVKLSDRGHNISTLAATSLGKQARILADTQTNYIPIFERLAARNDGFGLVASILLSQLKDQMGIVAERISHVTSESIAENKEPKPKPNFDQVHANFIRKLREKGFSSADVELIDLAYDFARFDRFQQSTGTFSAAREMTLELIDKMDSDALDSRLVVATLLQYSVQDGALFGSNFVPNFSYGRVAHLNLARIFGDQISHMITGLTPGEEYRVRPNQATLGKYVSQVERSGEQAVLITMLRAAHTLEAGLVPAGERNGEILQQISAFLPVFERLASHDGNFSRLAIITLGKIKGLYPQADNQNFN